MEEIPMGISNPPITLCPLQQRLMCRLVHPTHPAASLVEDLTCILVPSDKMVGIYHHFEDLKP